MWYWLVVEPTSPKNRKVSWDLNMIPKGNRKVSWELNMIPKGNRKVSWELNMIPKGNHAVNVPNYEPGTHQVVQMKP